MITLSDASAILDGVNEQDFNGWGHRPGGFVMCIPNAGAVTVDEFCNVSLELYGATGPTCSLSVSGARLTDVLEIELLNGLTVRIPVEGCA